MRIRTGMRGPVTGAAMLVALGVLMLPAPWSSAASAASCNGASHQVSLQGGRASPGSGTTATPIAFSVRYIDNAGCPPNAISLVIPGVGTYALSPVGAPSGGAQTYGVTRRLPVGSWGYRFSASSGSGAGERTVTLTSVTPTRVVISPSPTPTPTPTPTPRPTARPTPSPSPVATTKPTAKPTPTPAVASPTATAATPTAPATPAASATASGPLATGSGGPTPSATPRHGAGGPISRPPGSGGSSFASLPSILGRSDGLPIVTWMISTMLGVAVFAWVLRRRDDEAAGFDPALAAAMAASRAAPVAEPSPDPGWARIGSDVAPHEASLPRWRRPSLQAARDSAYAGPTLPRPPLVFDKPPAKGVERRTVGYRLVRIGDGPDEIRSTEIGRLERGDEVEVIEIDGRAARVRTPDGLEGWVDSVAILRVTDPSAD